MIPIRSAVEAMGTIVQEQRTDDLVDELPKRHGPRLPPRGVDGLTCSEAEVDALLSEGEST